MKTVKLSPSDFAFLLNECPRCYYHKYISQVYRPSMPMAKIFHVIDKGMQDFLLQHPLHQVSPGLPEIQFEKCNGFCTSEAVVFEDLNIQVYIHGKYDMLGKNLDIGGYVVGDGKTSFVKPENIAMYSAQLHGYGFALSKPADGSERADPIRRLGLVVFEPTTWSAEGGKAALHGNLVWQDIPLNKKEFMQMLRKVAEILSADEPPPAGENCSYCQYLVTMG